ncbi:MAG: UDP-N-acetylglucosamine 1-carboxyvinyltransferase [Cytophagales bacterium]|nr:UDP-N-acetylglucosamine 1-carboxyvinyltransferase [Cytophagales bacterium]
MASFLVEGGAPLKGEIYPQGAKNEALQVLAALLLSEKEVRISNLPLIRDVLLMIDILRELGVEVHREEERVYLFSAKHLNPEVLLRSSFQEKVGFLRGSILMIAPLLFRWNKLILSAPGGDNVGKRRMDTLMSGLKALGVKIEYSFQKNEYTFSTKGFVGSDILLEEASVTGTANLIMAAVMAKGDTTIYHAACEPYIQQLCRMLVRMGAKIEGIGTNYLRIQGVSSLAGTEHVLLADVIEVGSFIGLAALTQSEITIPQAGIKDLGATPTIFRKMGITVHHRGEDLHVPVQDNYVIKKCLDDSFITLSDSIWPGISPDLISIGIVTAIQAQGCVLFHQRMFESRLFFVDVLIQMGAHITLCDPHRVLVIGLNRQKRMRAVRMSSPDIRAGVALLLAALSAEGTSKIDNVEQIDRGYEDLCQRLGKIGARIRRID